jgi:hypothetical protein
MSYTRKTRDVWEVRGNYGQGYECVCASYDRREAVRDQRSHQENEPRVSFVLVKTRERIAVAPV